MSNETPTPETLFQAFGLLSHLYLTPVLVALIKGHVPDHLDAGPLPVAQLAEKSGLHELTVTRTLRALSAFGAFQEVSPGVFANTPVSEFFRDQPGGLRQECRCANTEENCRSLGNHTARRSITNCNAYNDRDDYAEPGIVPLVG